MIFQDKIASTALDYCYQYNPNWRCTGVTLCAWPNDTATVVIYANYTIECTGLTCRPVNGTYYKAVINTTDWSVIEFEPANESIFQEVISKCERVWNYSRPHKPSKRAYNPMALASGKITNILYDNNISDEALEPQLTYWVKGECPNCRILRAEAPLHINNATYLGFFNLTGKSLRLVPVNKSAVREYIEFFREHGGKVFPCNSTATGRVGNSTLKVEGGICVVPAVVNVGG